MVQTIPQIINLESEDIGKFVSKKNDIVYFNPQEAVGVAVTSEPVSLGKSFTLGERSYTIGELAEVHLLIINSKRDILTKSSIYKIQFKLVMV